MKSRSNDGAKQNNNNVEKSNPGVRCAIYTRKSTTDGLEQQFNSLDAQREVAEAYISSQKSENWICLPNRYDDGGFSGGNIERPALKRLIADIKAGKIDCLVTYKIDRISRSLTDFVKLMDIFEQYNVSFVSVTQFFNSANSMGRLTLNILLSFAQFEREIIAERTRDKMSAARKRGKWTGGLPVLGYDVDPKGGKLNINKEEAVKVKQIFELYLEHHYLIATVRELNRRGWTMKQWITKKGKERGGHPFDKCNLFDLLTNITYQGKVRHKDEIYPGEHEAIIDEALWFNVQKQLKRRNGSNDNKINGGYTRNKYSALLKDILYCIPCGTSMSHAYTSKSHNHHRRYGYYICLNAQKRGWDECPSKSIPAQEIEDFVIDQIKCIGKDPKLLNEAFDQAGAEIQAQVNKLKAEEQMLKRKLVHYNNELNGTIAKVSKVSEVSKVSFDDNKDSDISDRLANLQVQISTTEQQIISIHEQIKSLTNLTIEKNEFKTALSLFDPVWDELSIREQSRIIHLLIEKVGYDGNEETVSITLRPAGIKKLVDEAENYKL